MKKILLQGIKSRELNALLLNVAIFIILSFGSDTFLTRVSFESFQVTIAPRAVVAIGMMILFITGVFDLSVGSVMGLSGAVVALLMSNKFPFLPSIIVALCVGILFGLFNGTLIAYARVNPLIVTIGTLYVGRGLVNVLMSGSMGHGVAANNASFTILGQGKTLGLYNIFWVMIVVVVVVQFIIMRTYAGKYLYYIGGNYDAARLVGIKVKKIRMLTYVFSGFLAALGGIMATAQYGSSSLYLGTNYEMQIIIACLIGGASISGGRGSVIGSLLGMSFLSLIVIMFNIFEIVTTWQNVIIGIILIFVVALDAYLITRRKEALGETHL